MNSKYVIVALCASLIGMPAYAGFKDTLIRALPKVALCASAYQVFPYQIQTTHNVFMNPNKFVLDPEATLWIEETLRKHNALGKHEQQPACFYPEWATMNGTIGIPPQLDRDKHGSEIFNALHERGHVVLHHTQARRCLELLGLSAFWWSSLALTMGRAFLKNNSRTVPRAVAKSALLYTITSFGHGVPAFFSFLALSRSKERQADQFAIDHIADPIELEYQAQFWRKKESTEHSARTSLLNFHPSYLERAKTCEKGAAELRAKQQRKTS